MAFLLLVGRLGEGVALQPLRLHFLGVGLLEELFHPPQGYRPEILCILMSSAYLEGKYGSVLLQPFFIRKVCALGKKKLLETLVITLCL